MKIKFSTLIKRTLLVIIIAALAIVVLVFAFDKYKAATITHNNRYEDEYWNELKDFTKYPELVANVNSFNYLEKDVYKLPWEADGYNASGSNLSDKQKVEYARYQEELTSITSSLRTKLRTLSFELESLQKGLPIDVMAWIEEQLFVSEEDINDYSGDKINSVYEFALTKEYEGTEEELWNDLRYAEYIEDVVDYGSDELQFAYSIVHDERFMAYLQTEDSAYLTKHNYQKIKDEYDALNETIQLADEKMTILLPWKKYVSQVLLGYEGLATPYSGKPILTHTTADGRTFEFWLNVYYTTFKVVEKDANGNILQTWYSNPDEDNPNYAGKEISTDFRTIFNLNYAVFAVSAGTLSNYEYSVSNYNLKKDTEELTPNYAIKFDVENNKVTVWYHLESRGINYSFFPKYLTEERYWEIISRNEALYRLVNGNSSKEGTEEKDLKELGLKRQDLIDFIGTYKLIQATDATNEFEGKFAYYTIEQYSSKMSNQVLNLLNNILYGICDYNSDGEELDSDNEYFSQRNEVSNPKYSIAIEYSLGENGLSILVPGNSIVDDPDYPLTTIDLLPYFTATLEGIEGYTIIPDGSGGIMSHDNGNYTYSAYSKRVYTTDLTSISYVNEGSVYDLMFPMYAVVNAGNKSGILAYSTDGASQLQLNADVSGRLDNLNKNYYTIYLRETEVITIGTTSYNRKRLVKWTSKRCEDDILLTYRFLDEDEQSYSEVAKVYRDILKQTYNFENKDVSKTPTLDMNVLGTYSFTDNFIGIPYTKKESLTTIDQLNEIISAVQSGIGDNAGVEFVNAFYYGWRSTNLKDTSFKKVKMSSLIGSKKKFESLLENSNKVNVYPYVNFGEYVKYQESFGKYHYTAHCISGDFAIRQEYELNTNVFKKTADEINVLSPKYYLKFAQNLADNYKKVAKNASSLAVEKLGYGLSGDYKRNKEMFKTDAIKEQLKSLDYLYEKGINNLTLYTPYDYAFKYTTVAKDIPFSTTEYEIIDYSIPFYQLVVNGLFDYSGESYNAISEKGMEEYLMHLIETGSNMAYTFTYESSNRLLQTDYNYYYYTQYTDWLNDVNTMYTELCALGIYDGQLVNHEIITNDIYKVEYNTPSGIVSIYLNYTRNSYTTSDGITIPAKNFVKGN